MGGSRRRLDSVKDVVRPGARVVKQSVCSRRFAVQSAKTVGLVLCYYTFSISLTFFNNRFIHAFKFPLSITMTHLTTKFIVAGIIRAILEWRTGKKRVMLSWGPYIKKVAPPGVASTLDIGLSNWSFEFITISLYTMTKSTTIIFVMGFSLLFRLEKPRCSLVFIVVFIAIGLLMFTYESTQFNLFGFLLVLTASFLSGLRWTLSQMVLQKNELGLTNPLDMMYHIQPWMMLSLLPLSAIIEGVHIATSHHVFNYKLVSVLLEHLSILTGGALLAFMLELSEYLLLSQTSSLTLSVSGIVKEIFTLVLAATINGDHMSFINGIGLVVCLIGILIHIIFKAVHQNEEKKAAHDLDESVEMLLHNGEAREDDDECDEIEVFNVRRDR